MSGELPPGEPLSRAQEQARARRERRNAKIQASGASRLEAITSLSGRKGPPPESTSTPTNRQNEAAQPPPGAVNSSSRSNSGLSSSTPPDPFARPPQGAQDPSQPNASFENPDDPLMKLMQQMIAASSGGQPEPGQNQQTNGAGPDFSNAGLPPALAQLLNATQQQQQGPGQAQQRPASSFEYVWRILHAVFSISLGIYVAIGASFTGSSAARSRTGVSWADDDSTTSFGDESSLLVGRRLFWIFATVEAVLQSSRYFMERSRPQAGGLLAMLGGILPEPLGSNLRLFSRYSTIVTTVAADAMIIVFVLGVMAWWKDAQPAFPLDSAR